MTADEIARTYNWTIVINRWAATWIDFILLALIIFVPLKVLGIEMFERTSVIWFTAVALYFPVCEGFNGTTLGKMAAGIRVVDNDLDPPGFTKALIRTVFRLIEVNPILFGGIPAGVFVLTSNTRQRLGDRVAGTYVLRVRDIAAAENTEGGDSSE